MYTDCSKYDTSVLRIRIELSKSGRRAFNRLNAKLGQAYIRFFQLERDLAEYIERHIDAGIDMTEEFTVRYEGGIFLTVYLCRGVYCIADASDAGTIVAAKAIMVWKRVKRGIELVTAHVLVGWQLMRACC